MTKIDKQRPDLNVLIDYVAVTFPVDTAEAKNREYYGDDLKTLFANIHFKILTKILNVNVSEYTDCGKIQHYNKLITYKEHIHFKFNGPLDASGNKTHSLELKGEGCREVERLGIDWYQLFSYIHYQSLTLSTLHIACDIFTKNFFTIESLLKKSLRNEYISWSRRFNVIDGRAGDEKTGTSLYFGRRDDNQINIYDKKNERYYKGYDVDTNVWYRVELRLKANKSWDFLRKVVVSGIEQLPHLYASVLKSMLDFKTKSKDSNKTRWKTWKNWDDFLKTSEKTKLINQAKLESTLVRKREWLIDSAGKAILELFSAIDSDEMDKFYNEIIERKLEKIDNKSLTRINDFRHMKGLDPFDDLDDLKDYMIETRFNTS